MGRVLEVPDFQPVALEQEAQRRFSPQNFSFLKSEKMFENVRGLSIFVHVPLFAMQLENGLALSNFPKLQHHGAKTRVMVGCCTMP